MEVSEEKDHRRQCSYQVSKIVAILIGGKHKRKTTEFKRLIEITGELEKKKKKIKIRL